MTLFAKPYRRYFLVIMGCFWFVLGAQTIYGVGGDDDYGVATDKVIVTKKEPAKKGAKKKVSASDEYAVAGNTDKKIEVDKKAPTAPPLPKESTKLTDAKKARDDSVEDQKQKKDALVAANAQTKACEDKAYKASNADICKDAKKNQQAAAAAAKKADQKVAAAQKSVDKEQDSVDKSVAADAAAKAATDDVKNKAADKDKADKALADAKAKTPPDPAAVKAAEEKQKQAQKDLDASAKKADQANKAKASALEKTETPDETKQRQADEAVEAHDKSQAAKADAKAKADNAVAEQTKAQSDAKDAMNAKKAADDKVKNAKTPEEKKAALEEQAAAQKKLDEASKKVTSANKEVAAAKAASDKASKDADKAAAAANTALLKTETPEQTNKRLADEALTKKQAADAAHEEAQGNLSNAKQVSADADQAVVDAKAKCGTQKNCPELTTALAAQKDAKANLATAQTNAEAAKQASLVAGLHAQSAQAKIETPADTTKRVADEAAAAKTDAQATNDAAKAAVGQAQSEVDASKAKLDALNAANPKDPVAIAEANKEHKAALAKLATSKQTLASTSTALVAATKTADTTAQNTETLAQTAARRASEAADALKSKQADVTTAQQNVNAAEALTATCQAQDYAATNPSQCAQAAMDYQNAQQQLMEANQAAAAAQAQQLEQQQAAQLANMNAQQAQVATAAFSSAQRDVAKTQENLDAANQAVEKAENDPTATDEDKARAQTKVLQLQAELEASKEKLQAKQRAADAAVAVTEKPEETAKRHMEEGQKALADIVVREANARNKLLGAEEDLRAASKLGDEDKIEKAKLAVMQAKTELDVILAEKEAAQQKMANAQNKLTTPEQRRKLAADEASSKLEELKKQQVQAKQVLNDAQKALEDAILSGDEVAIQQAKDAIADATTKYEEITAKVKLAQDLVDKRNKKEEKKKEEIQSIATAGNSLQKAREAEISTAREVIKARRLLQKDKKNKKGKNKKLEEESKDGDTEGSLDAKKKNNRTGNLASKEDAYAKAKEAVEKIVADARKNPELKKKLEEAALKLKEAEKQEQDAQATLGAAIKSYHKTKDNSEAGGDDIKTVEEARGAAFISVKKIDEELVRNREAYETLFGQTENTKQLRQRDYKRLLNLKPLREKALKSAERELSGLEGQMDKLLSDAKSKDKDITALEQKIEESKKNLDTMETEWEQTAREISLTKLRSETVIEKCTRERDRAQERLTALQDHAKSKKAKKAANDQDFKDEIDVLRKALMEKETALQAAQKAKDAQDLDVAAVGFDPEDPMDAETLEEEITTPEERAAAKKAFHKILQDYKMAKKAVAEADKALMELEQQYLDVKGQKNAKGNDIKVITRNLKSSQFTLIRAIRAELKTKRAYEIALRQTETLKQTRLRILRELEALVKSLEQRFAGAKKALADAQTELTQSQNAKPLDKKAMELSTEEVDFAKARVARINRDKDLAYKSLKIAREKAAMYLSANEKKARGIRKTPRMMEEDYYDDEEWQDEDDPLAYRDEDEEDLQSEIDLESEDSILGGAEEETDVAGKIINQEIALEKAEPRQNPLSPGVVPSSDAQDLPISETSRDAFDGPPGGQGNGDDLTPHNNPSYTGKDNLEEGSQYLIPSGKPETGEPAGAGGEENPIPGEQLPTANEDDAEKKRLEDEAEAKRIADEDAEAQRLEDDEAAMIQEDEEEVGNLDLPPEDIDPMDEDGAGEDPNEEGVVPLPPDAAAASANVVDARGADEVATRGLEAAEETGDRKNIINAEIYKEKADAKLAQAQIKQSGFGNVVPPQEQTSWANSYGKDLFDPEASDKGGVFNPKPGNSQDVSDLVMEGSNLTKPEYLVERPRVSVMERPGTSASVQSKLNASLPNFQSDTGIETL